MAGETVETKSALSSKVEFWLPLEVLKALAV
jgi:hypothetical protein